MSIGRAVTTGGVIVPPYVSEVSLRAQKVGDLPKGQRRTCAIFHMEMEGNKVGCLVPIIWFRVLSDLPTPDPVLTRVECIGLIWGEFLGKREELVVTTRFDIPLAQFQRLQVAEVTF